MCKHTFVDQSMYKHTFVVINDIEQVFCLWIWPQRNRNYIWKPKKFKPRLNWNVEKEIYETGRVISYWLYYINNKEWTHKSEREKENSDTICVYVHGALRYTCSLAPSRPNKAFREKGQKKNEWWTFVHRQGHLLLASLKPHKKATTSCNLIGSSGQNRTAPPPPFASSVWWMRLLQHTELLEIRSGVSLLVS